MILTLLILIALFTIVKHTVNNNGGLVGYQPVLTQTPVLTPNAPKTFNFDASTNLKQELDKVNPQVLDSDFE